MARTVGIGIQSFEKIIENNYLYIDKTDFIREWWERGDDVTLITRPRRFGKTLNISMTETGTTVLLLAEEQTFIIHGPSSVFSTSRNVEAKKYRRRPWP